MPWRLYLTIASVLIALATGWQVRGWHDNSATLSAVVKADKAVAKTDQSTLSHTLAAATRIQAIQINLPVLQDQIQLTPLNPGDGHASTAPAPVCPRLDAGAFRLLWNAGSHAAPLSKARDLPHPNH